MVTVRNKNYIGKRGSKGKMMNVPAGPQSGGKLTKNGLVYRNDLLDADLTSQQATRRKLKGM